MKYRLHQLLLVFICVLCSAQVFADDGGKMVAVDGINYECLADKTAKVAGFESGSAATDLIVPENIMCDGEQYTVTAVRNSAFMMSETLADIQLPKTVKTIEYSAFDGCTKLTEVKLNEGLEDLQYDAFGMCTSLVTAELPSTLKKMGSMVFFGCSELESIDIPEGVEVIEEASFQSCYMLASVTLPQSLRKIGKFAFSDCGITSVAIPEGVTCIDDFAFYFSTMLFELNIPENIEYVGDGAFDYTAWYDEWLEQQPEGLIYLGKVAYKYNGDAPAGTKVVIKDGTIKIAMSAFGYCAGIEEIDVPASVTAFGPRAFRGCGDLKTIVIPETIKLIDSETFKECTGLESINIPEGVERLGMSAFYGCTSLKTVVIPSTVTELGAGVFEQCSALQKVYSNNKTAPAMQKSGEGESVFFENEVYKNATLYIPEGSLVSYTGTGDWGKFINVVQGDNLAVENVENTEAAVIVKDGAIVLPAGIHAEVYDMTGRLVYSGIESVIGVRQGMYVVKVNGSVTKVVVK